MKLIYTRSEINAANEMVQQIIVAVTGSSLKDKTIEEQVALSNGLFYFADNGDVVMEVPEHVMLKLFSIYQKHLPTITGIIVMFKGIAMTFKAMSKTLVKELNSVALEFENELTEKKRAESEARMKDIKEDLADQALNKASE